MDLPQTTPRAYQHCSAILTINNHTLYIGDLSSVQDEQSLRMKNIQTVITAVQGYDITLSRDFKHHTFYIQDNKTQNIGQYLDEADKKIAVGLKIGSVLVHCAAGVSRSPTLVIAYLIKTRNMTFHEALKLCKSRRPEICPNIGFERQLKQFQKSQKEKDDKQSRLRNLLKEHLPARPHNEIQPLPPKLPYARRIGNSGGGGLSRLTSKRPFFQHRDTRRLTPLQKRENYLRQIAQFRFGITSLGKFTEHHF